MTRSFPRLKKRLSGLCAFGVPLLVYVLSAHPGVDFWDTGEMQTVPYVLGVAHPTGFPAFTLLGYVFSHLLPLGTPAWRLTLMCSISMALAAWLVARAVDELSDAAPIGAAAAVLFAVGEVAWTRATRTEVHALATLCAAVTLFFLIRWYRTREPTMLYGVAIGAALGIATHPVTALLGPGIVVVLFARSPRPAPRSLIVAAAILAAGMALYAYIPLRSAQVFAQHRDPTLALGIAPGRPFWDYGHPSASANFWRYVSGNDFDARGALGSMLTGAAPARLAGRFLPALTDELTVTAVDFALLGLLGLFLRAPPLAAGLALAALLPVPFALNYRAESDVERYFLSAFWMTAVFAGAGAATLSRALLARRPGLIRLAGACVLGLLALTLFYRNAGTFAQRNDDSARRFIDRVIAQTPSDAIVVANWSFATPLAYAAYVEGRLGDRIVDTAWPADEAPLIRMWSKRRPVVIVEPTHVDLPGVRLDMLSAEYPALLRVR